MFILFINYNYARDSLFEKFEKSLKIKTAAGKLPQNETWNTTLFLELFLERLPCLCEILGRECVQAFCSSWTPNTHNTARFNVIICSERRNPVSKLNNPSMLFDTQKEKVPRECCFSTQHTRPTTINDKLQENHTARLPATAIPDHGKEKLVSEEQGVLCGMVAPIKAVPVVSRTMDRGKISISS